MHLSVMQFFENDVPKQMFEGSVIEVGSLDVNGSVRSIVEPYSKRYLGIDFIDGPGVDRVLDAEQLFETFGHAAFDTVISTEMLEHAEHWRECINNMKRICGKYLIITTRSPGFGYHEYPHDYWRYTLDDFKRIFADFKIHKLISDPLIHEGKPVPGVFMIAEQQGRELADLSKIELAGPA